LALVPPSLPSPTRGEGTRVTRLAAAALLAVGLGACLRPLHAPTASGARVSDALAAIEIAPVETASTQARLSHYLRSELVYDLNGSGQPQPKRYKLTIAAAEVVVAPIVESVTGRAAAATLRADAQYTLTTLDGTRVITSGKATASASYDRFPQRFANVRAARDAEIRAAKLLSEQIRTRLSAALATGA
jgi:LPS-assembly lipoprotein